MVNKGLALFQWKQNPADAERCCYEALQIDAECEAAVTTLAQLSLQQGKVETAVQLFDRQAQLARSEPELVGALTYKHVRWLSCYKRSQRCCSRTLLGHASTASVHQGLSRVGRRDGPARAYACMNSYCSDYSCYAGLSPHSLCCRPYTIFALYCAPLQFYRPTREHFNPNISETKKAKLRG